MIKRKKIVSIFITAAFLLSMLLGSVPASSAGAVLSDVEGHWAQDTIQNMVSEGIIGGYPDGSFKPNNNITRAEFATLLVKAFDLAPGSGKVFGDTADHWAKDAISTANYHGLVSGYSDTAFGPDDPVTREQIAAMIVGATKVELTGGKSFADSSQISAWARQSVDKAAAAGLIAGYADGTFKPKANATRAEASVILDRGRKLPVAEITTYDAAGTYGPAAGKQEIDSSVTISADGVILQNIVISGNLVIAKAVGNGDVTLKNVTVKGTTFIRGGGKDSIYFNGGKYAEVIVEGTPGKSVRLVAANNAEGIQVIISEKATGEEVILEGSFEGVTVKADNAVLSTQGKTTLKSLKVVEGVSGITINLKEGTTVKELILDSVTKVENISGTITKLSGTKAASSDVKNRPAVSSGGGGGGGSGVAVAVTGISVAPGTMQLEIGAAGIIAATVEPANASNKGVFWTTSNAAVATVVNGQVTAVAAGTATITATSAADSSKAATCVVTVSGEATGTATIKVEVGDPLASFKKLTVLSATVGSDFMVEGSTKKVAVGSSITVMTNAESVDVTLYDADGEVIGIIAVGVTESSEQDYSY